MQHLPRSGLLAHQGGRHFASEPHVRMQVLPVPVGTRESLFDQYHGELLIHCLDGTCVVATAEQAVELAAGDQVLLIDGEPFRIERARDQDGIVQLVWMPGLNPCRTCWERDGKFFAKDEVP